MDLAGAGNLGVLLAPLAQIPFLRAGLFMDGELRVGPMPDGAGDRCCLVHSDFNPKNLLVDPASGEITGLVDWEFAHAGSPYADLGNLLRFDRAPDFVAAVLESYVERTPAVPANVLDLARSADLWALVELASRREANPVAGRAHDQLLAIARTGDLHAEP